MLTVARATVVVLVAAALLAGCGNGPDVALDPPPAQPSAVSPERTTPPSRSVPPGSRPPALARPTTPVFSEQTAVPCDGYPSGEQIIGLLRRTTRLLPSNVTAAVRTGPLCAGTWQYTVLLVPDRDPLQVVTRGAPASLRLVTAGTDICTVDVRATAPAGIRAITRC